MKEETEKVSDTCMSTGSCNSSHSCSVWTCCRLTWARVRENNEHIYDRDIWLHTGDHHYTLRYRNYSAVVETRQERQLCTIKSADELSFQCISQNMKAEACEGKITEDRQWKRERKHLSWFWTAGVINPLTILLNLQQQNKSDAHSVGWEGNALNSREFVSTPAR